MIRSSQAPRYIELFVVLARVVAESAAVGSPENLVFSLASNRFVLKITRFESRLFVLTLDVPPQIHSYGISIQTPCVLRILEQQNQNSSASVRIQEKASRGSCLIQKLSQVLPPRINTLCFGTFWPPMGNFSQSAGKTPGSVTAR